MAQFNHKESNVSIVSSYFYKNLADLVTCIYAEQRQGVVHLFNNTFLENSAVTENRVLIGSASVIQASGIFTVVTSINNLFFRNRAEYASVIGIYYGKFYEENSKFIGFFHVFFANSPKVVLRTFLSKSHRVH